MADETYLLNGVRHAVGCPANIEERYCVCGAAALVVRLQQRRQINEFVQKQPDDRVQQAAIDEMRKHSLAVATVEASVIKRIKDILNNEVPPGRSIAMHQGVQLAGIRAVVGLPTYSGVNDPGRLLQAGRCVHGFPVGLHCMEMEDAELD